MNVTKNIEGQKIVSAGFDIEDDDGTSPIPTMAKYPPDDGSKTYRLLRKARLATDQDLFVKAMAYSAAAIQEARREKRPLLECAALCVYAIETSSTGLFNEALSIAQEALQLAQTLKDKTLEARAYCAIAYVALETQDEAEAIDVLERGLLCAKESQSDHDLFWSLNNLAHVYHDRAMRFHAEVDTGAYSITLAKSIAYATDALVVARRGGVWLQLSFAMMNLVNGEFSRGNWREAKSLVDQYTKIAAKHQQYRVLAFGNLDYARLFAAQSRFRDAIDCLETSEHFETLCVTDDLTLRSHEALSTYYKKERAFEKVVEHLEAARTVERRIQAAQADRHIRALSAKLDVEDARAEAKLQRAHAETLEARNALLERDRQDLERSAMHDPLTDLGNRRAADEDLLWRLETARSERASFGVCYLDLDHFKSINDRFGHHIGDRVLKEVSQILTDTLRGADKVYRYGGEEFLVLISDQTKITCSETCERLRKAIASYQWANIHKELEVTASFGVAVWMKEDDGQSVTKRADTALYRAKKMGRNQVVTG